MPLTDIRVFPKDSYKVAMAYAKAMAIQTRRTVTARRVQNGWEVDGVGASPDLQTYANDATAFRRDLSAIRQILEASVNPEEISNAIDKFLTDFNDVDGNAQSTAEKDDQALAGRLIDLHAALMGFIEFLQSQEDVKFRPQYRDDAQEYAVTLSEVLTNLDPYPVSKRVDMEKRRMLELAKVLPSKDIAQSQQQWLQKVARLNGLPDRPVCRICKPEAKMHIVGNQEDELWRCNENNHGTRFLSKEHRDILR